MNMTARPNYQAFRSSCDRCRFHKLKCTGSTSPQRQCDRCFRAKVECVFSRRAQMMRNQRSPSEMISGINGRDTATDSTDVTINVKTPGTTLADVDSSKITTKHTESVSVARSKQGSSKSPPPLSSNLDEGSAAISDSPSGMISANNFYSLENDWAWPQLWDGMQDVVHNEHDSSMDDECSQQESLYEADEDNLSSQPQQHLISVVRGTTMMAPSDILVTDTIIQPELYSYSEERSGLTSCNDNQISQANMLRLSKLVAGIQDASNMLSNGPWADPNIEVGSSDMLSRYPIGGILHVVRKFKVILEDIGKTRTQSIRTTPGTPLLSSTINMRTEKSGEEMSSAAANPQVYAYSSSFPMIDTPTRLLALSCHVSLVKLHGIVFTHLENILNMMPASSQASSSSSSPRHDAMINDDHLARLRLCHLPTIDEACSKIHTAVAMMLQAFRSVEVALDALRNPFAGQLGPEPAVNDSVASLSWNSFGSLDDSPAVPYQFLAINKLGQDPILGNTAVQEEFDDALTRLQALKRVLMKKLDMQ